MVVCNCYGFNVEIEDRITAGLKLLLQNPPLGNLCFVEIEDRITAGLKQENTKKKGDTLFQWKSKTGLLRD